MAIVHQVALQLWWVWSSQSTSPLFFFSTRHPWLPSPSSWWRWRRCSSPPRRSKDGRSRSRRRRAPSSRPTSLSSCSSSGSTGASVSSFPCSPPSSWSPSPEWRSTWWPRPTQWMRPKMCAKELSCWPSTFPPSSSPPSSASPPWRSSSPVLPPFPILCSHSTSMDSTTLSTEPPYMWSSIFAPWDVQIFRRCPFWREVTLSRVKCSFIFLWFLYKTLI